MALLTVQNITRSGLAPSYSAAAGGGDTIPSPDSETFLHVRNGGGSAITVTIATPGTVLGDLAVADVSVSVPAGGERMIGPLPYAHFADPATGNASISYSSVTSVTVAAIRLRQP